MQQKFTKSTRRSFIKKSAVTAAGLAIGLPAKSYNRILGANDRINFGVAGLNGRGNALMAAITSVPNTSIVHLCDVDSRVLEKATGKVKKELGQT
ncbi:MAG: twin-arginine translocation signal domain-containing protein, partial [Bacteroidota bacterium]